MDATKKQSTELKKTELEILIAFIDACKELNLKYYVVGGTLIGTIRHKGFIPWDDDIDVAMPREDYEVFMKNAQSVLPEHLFVQNIYTDKEYLTFFAKIRNSNTTFLESSNSHLHINHGVYIDIFPLDYFPENKWEQRKVLLKNKLYARRICSCFNIQAKKTLRFRLISFLMKIVYPSVRAVIEKRDEMAKAVPKSTMFASYGGAWGYKEVAPIEWFGDGKVDSFEGIEVVVPAGYHKWMTQIYGDYMQLPPEEKRVAHHYADVIDLERSYKYYMENRP